jgi:hypothetical protein
MDGKLPQNNHIPPIYMRLTLFVVLFVSGMVIVSSVRWIYRRIQGNLGFEIAEVVVAFLMVLIFILILFGFGAGFGADRILRKRKIQAFWIYRSLKRSRFMRSLWIYIEPHGQMEPENKRELEMTRMLTKKPRRGRHPTYSLDRWMRVVQAWENRDPLRNTLTLSEFLGEEFGTYADGSPQMSENSYYDWRKKVFKELRKLEARKKEKIAS